MRDYQQQKVYDWENEIVSPKDKVPVPISSLPSVVNHIWEGEGLKYPPVVMPLPPNASKTWADANRTRIRFGKNVPTWVVIHEISHSMTSDFERGNNGHGADFVGIYIKLLHKYLGIELDYLMTSAIRAKIDFEIGAMPLERKLIA